jgi:hypothetical protein
MELKFESMIDIEASKALSINRTFMELKFFSRTSTVKPATGIDSSINRTFMELKLV